MKISMYYRVIWKNMDYLKKIIFLCIVKLVRLFCIFRMKIKIKKLKFNFIINYRKNN